MHFGRDCALATPERTLMAMSDRQSLGGVPPVRTPLVRGPVAGTNNNPTPTISSHSSTGA